MTQASAKEERYQAEILEALHKAGRSGKTKTGLPGRTGSQARQTALKKLVKEGRVATRRVGKASYYWLPEHAPSRQTVEQSLHAVCGARKPMLFSKKDLQALLPADEKSLLKEVLPSLVADNTFHEFRRGKLRYYLYLPTLLATYIEVESPSIASDTVPDNAMPTPSSRPPFSAEAVHRAYETLKARTGYPFVMINRLRDESGQDLEDLHRYLREQWAAGHAELSEADWSIASEAERGAALHEGRERYLNVRLK